MKSDEPTPDSVEDGLKMVGQLCTTVLSLINGEPIGELETTLECKIYENEFPKAV